MKPAIDVAEFDDDWVIRKGLIFRFGNYKDKDFSLSPGEFTAAHPEAPADFAPVPIDLSHTGTVLDGKMGELIGTEVKGDELHGTVRLRKWLDDVLTDADRKVSCEWNRATKRLNKLSLVPTPRVTDAALFASFSVAHPEAIDDDARAAFAKDRTRHGQTTLQSVHDRCAEAGAICRDDGNDKGSMYSAAFSAVLFHSAPELRQIQVAHDAACEGGATCRMYSKEEMNHRGPMFSELVAFTDRKRHDHLTSAMQGCHDLIAMYPGGCPAVTVPGLSPDPSTLNTTSPLSSFGDSTKQSKALARIHSIATEHGARCPAMGGKSSFSTEANSMSKDALIAAVGALPDMPSDNDIQAFYTAAVAALPESARPKFASFAAPKSAEPEPESAREKALRLQVEAIQADREKDRKAAIEDKAATFSLDLFKAGKLLPKAVPLVADLYRELTDDDHAHAKTVSFGATDSRKTGGRLALFSAFIEALPTHGLFDPAITGDVKLADLSGASNGTNGTNGTGSKVLFNSDGMPIDRDNQPVSQEQHDKNLSYTEAGRQILRDRELNAHRNGKGN